MLSSPGGIRIAAASLLVAVSFLMPSQVRSEPAPSIDELAQAAQAAETAFVPLSESDVKGAETELQAALARLDARLNAAGPEAKGWRSYLRWGAAEEELKRQGGPDLTALDAIHAKYAAGYRGLGLKWFADVRIALRKYLIASRLLGDDKLQTQYEALLKTMPQRLAMYDADPTPEGAEVLSNVLIWLADAGQAERFSADIRHRFSQPNLYAQVSSGVIVAGLTEPVDEVSPVRDVILGASIHGTGHTTGRLSAELIPAVDFAQLNSVFRGKVETDTIARKGPARVYSAATTKLQMRKPILIDADGVRSLPATSDGSTRSTIKSVRAGRSGGLLERFARKRAYKQKCQAEWIGARHAEQRINQRADDQGRELVGQTQEAFGEKFRKPLDERRLFPELLQFSTTDTALNVACLQAGPYDLGASTTPPETAEGVDMAVRLHESLINNFAQGALAGVVLEEERLQTGIADWAGSFPQRFKADEEAEPWGITFAARRPISVAFADGLLSVTIRGQTYRQGEKSYPGMNVTATYEITKTADGFMAVRQGELEIFPPGFVAGSGRQLSVPQQVLRDLLQRRFAKVFEQEIVLKDLDLPGRWGDAGALSLAQMEASEGWLALAWKRAEPPETPETEPATP